LTGANLIAWRGEDEKILNEGSDGHEIVNIANTDEKDRSGGLDGIVGKCRLRQKIDMTCWSLINLGT
jgi:hypothetical protein